MENSDGADREHLPHQRKEKQTIRSLRILLKSLFSILPPELPRFIYLVVLRFRPIRSLTHNLLRKIIPPEIRIEEGTIILNQDDPVLSGALSLGIHELTFRRLFTESIKPGMTILDIGANIGYYTLISSVHAGENGLVIAFEPEQVNATILEKMITVNTLQNVLVSRYAIGERNSDTPLYVDPDNKGKHSLLPTDRYAHILVQTKTLSDALSEFPKRKIDLIKMDIEGWEAKAFRGMWDIIGTSHPEIFFEYAPNRIIASGENPLALLQHLKEIGYNLMEINERNQSVIPITDMKSFTARFRNFDDYSDIHARHQNP